MTQLETQFIDDLTGTREGQEDDLETIDNDDWRDAVSADELRVFEGNLKLDGHLDVSNGALIVRGDLTVAGTVALDETGTLVVTGTLRCRNLSCEGNLEVQGDAIVEEAITGHYEAGISFFLGAVRAQLLLEGNHSFEYEPEQLELGHHLRFDNHQGMSLGTKEDAERVLSDEALDVFGQLMALSKAEPTRALGDVLREHSLLRR